MPHGVWGMPGTLLQLNFSFLRVANSDCCALEAANLQTYLLRVALLGMHHQGEPL